MLLLGTQKLGGTRCAGCFPAPPRIFQGNRQDQGVPLQTTSRSKGFDWAELLRVRYPVASLASTCFALLQLEPNLASFKMWRNAPLRREPASPRRDQYSLTDTTNGLPGASKAQKSKGDGSNCEPGFGPVWNFEFCGILNWTLQSCLDGTCASSRLVCPTKLSVNVESSKPLLDQVQQF